MFDWVSRFKNPTFVTSFATALIAFGYTVLGMFDVVPSVSESEVLNLVAIVVTMLTSVGVLMNPTTDGITD